MHTHLWFEIDNIITQPWHSACLVYKYIKKFKNAFSTTALCGVRGSSRKVNMKRKENMLM